ncbi:hypothetical protein HEK616_31900 [Streptomyces nigrescens]|uniref:Uncharacterized protein n=1 Tax=Streptomyces nigrescens TaxID=1920 RepID=A0ABM7ZTJ3_STRNI|nr:hypothetical protein HEK616_31900 [Streptomyces nigrescens]
MAIRDTGGRDFLVRQVEAGSARQLGAHGQPSQQQRPELTEGRRNRPLRRLGAVTVGVSSPVRGPLLERLIHANMEWRPADPGFRQRCSSFSLSVFVTRQFVTAGARRRSLRVSGFSERVRFRGRSSDGYATVCDLANADGKVQAITPA